jgi:hypothetical protein
MLRTSKHPLSTVQTYLQNKPLHMESFVRYKHKVYFIMKYCYIDTQTREVDDGEIDIIQFVINLRKLFALYLCYGLHMHPKYIGVFLSHSNENSFQTNDFATVSLLHSIKQTICVCDWRLPLPITSVMSWTFTNYPTI